MAARQKKNNAKSKRQEKPRAVDDRTIGSALAPRDRTPAPDTSHTLTRQTVLCALSALAAGWIAAESTGLLDDPLRRILMWVALGFTFFADRDNLSLRPPRLMTILVGITVVFTMTGSSLTPVNVLAAAVLPALLATGRRGPAADVYRLTAWSVTILAIYVVARTSIPYVWLTADRMGGAIGSIAGFLTGRPLWVGATFSGIDFLLLTTTLYLGCLFSTPPPRRVRAISGLIAIVVCHLSYLAILSFADQIAAAQAEDAEGAAQVIRKIVPWNMPVLAGVFHLVIASTMICWLAKSSEDRPGPVTIRTQRWGRTIAVIAAIILAVLLPVATSVHPKHLLDATVTYLKLDDLLPIDSSLGLKPTTLKGKKIVAYEKGFLNWLKPKHGEYGRLSVGMYGMMPVYVNNLGGQFLISPDLSTEDLADADVLVLLFPDEPWKKGQLDRIWSFVRNGGSLLVMGEHTVKKATGGNPINEVLEPIATRVQFDSATFAVGGWLKSYEVMTHPSTAGVPDDRNQFGVVIGATVDPGWSSRPLLVGRWGWADPGDKQGNAMMGNGRYDAGEKLGDLVLATEQQIGRGRIITFGDTSGMTNGITVGSHVFTSRLLGYLATKPPIPHALWRQILGLLCTTALLVLLSWRSNTSVVAVVILALGASLVACNRVNQQMGEVLPDGRHMTPNRLAYVDNSHLEAAAGESWRADGLGAFELTLMRNDYLVLDLPKLTRRRLLRAGLLFSVAPARKYSDSERVLIREFVTNGGIFICTVGNEKAVANRSLLADLGFEVGLVESTATNKRVEPQPMGHFKAPYLNLNGELIYVRYHAAWPVAFDPTGARVLAYGLGDKPVIVMRDLGKGKVLVVADTCFAMTKNLENEGGEPIEGRRENADFWRWLLTQLTGQPTWLPTSVQTEGMPTLGPPILDISTDDAVYDDVPTEEVMQEDTADGETTETEVNITDQEMAEDARDEVKEELEQP